MSDSDIQALSDLDVSLDQALSGDIPSHTEQVETVADPGPAPEAKAEPTGVSDATPASEEATRQVPLKAYEAERDKRQAAEARLRELEARTRENTHSVTTDPLEDPEGFSAQVQETIEQRVALAKFELHEEAMREKHADYDEVQAEFLTMAQSNPALMAEARQARNVPKFAYATVMKARELAELQDVDTYKSKLRQQIEAEIRADLEREAGTRRAKAAELDSALELPSLATTGSGGIRDADASLSSILGDDANARRRR
jgi:hypothetical protein